MTSRLPALLLSIGAGRGDARTRLVRPILPAGGEPGPLPVGAVPDGTVEVAATVLTVGRAPDVELPIDDQKASRRHCVFQAEVGGWVVRDAGSLNGTFVNVDRVETWLLRHGDRVRLGDTEILVEFRFFGAESSGLGRCPQCGAGLTADTRGLPICSACRERVATRVAGGSDGRADGGAAAVGASGSGGAGSLASLPPLTVACCGCGADWTREADADRRARRFRTVARYWCDACAERRQQECELFQIGGYRLLSRLGSGGMGVVYLGRDEVSGRLAAVKWLSRTAADPELAARFSREMQILDHLIHPNIVRLYDAGVSADISFYASEFVAGGSAADRLQRAGGPLPWLEVRRLGMELLRGLDYLHRKRIVHRDIKPANILVGEAAGAGAAAGARLADFGLAKCWAQAGGDAITRAGEFAGSPLYAAPEQILSFREVGATADLYAVGISLYELLTGTLPWDFPADDGQPWWRKDGRDPMHLILNEPPIPIRRRRPDVPAPVAEVIDRAMRRSAAERFASAAEFGKALELAGPHA